MTTRQFPRVPLGPSKSCAGLRNPPNSNFSSYCDNLVSASFSMTYKTLPLVCCRPPDFRNSPPALPATNLWRSGFCLAVTTRNGYAMSGEITAHAKHGRSAGGDVRLLFVGLCLGHSSPRRALRQAGILHRYGPRGRVFIRRVRKDADGAARLCSG